MTKTLITISFALDWDEDDLAMLAQTVEEGIRQGVAASAANSTAAPEEWEAIDDVIDFYGVSLTLKKPILGVGA